MAEGGNKIKDLISEGRKEFMNYDGSVWTRTCTEEILDPIEGEVSGEIPHWINGCLLQNGPGAYESGDVTFNHVFDGMAQLHRFNIVDGKVTYQHRFIKSRAYEAVMKENRIGFSEFATNSDPVGSLASRFFSIFKLRAYSPTDNTAVSIYPIGEDTFYAFTETSKIHQFDATSLETLDRVCLRSSVNIIFQTAHPIVTQDGSLYNIGISMSSAGANYVLFCVPNVENKFKNVKIISKFAPKRKNYPSYMHSFAITENYFVVVEQPFTISAFEMGKSLLMRTNFMGMFKWFENEPVFVHLIDRKSGEIAHTFETETFFFFHSINAYEEKDHVVLDLICYTGPDIVQTMLIKNIRALERVRTKMTASRPLRFVFPLKYSADDEPQKNLVNFSGSETKAYMQSSGIVLCFPELLCNYPFEFGTLYFEKHYGKKYRYFYGVGMDMYTEYPGQLIKVDTENKSVLTWREDNAYPSEQLFVPSPNPTAEDDGVLVSALLKGKENTNYIGLLILDARTLKEIGRCEFKDLSTPISKTLHGWFMNHK